MQNALAGLAALAVAMGIGRFAFTPLLPMMAIDVSQAAWLASANYFGYLAGAITVRWGSARAGLALIAGATLAMGFPQPMAAWALWRALAGIASAWVLVHVSSYCLERGAHAGVLYSGVGIGIALTGLMCLAFMAGGLPAGDAWLALGALALAALPASWRIGKRATQESGAAHLWRHARLIACYGAFGFGYIVPATFIPAMARSLVDEPLVFGWAWPAFGAAAAVSTLGASPLLKRWGARRVWALAQGVMALGVAAPLVAKGFAGILIAALCVGASFMVITMAGMREAARLAAAPAGLMAAMTAAFAVGQIAGPLLVARWPIEAALAVAAAVLAASVLALLTRRNAHERTPAAA
jgi:MFS family permease